MEIPVAFSFAVFASTFIYSGMLSTMVCGLGRMKYSGITIIFLWDCSCREICSSRTPL